MTKAKLRKLYIEWRRSLAPETRSALSAAIAKKLFDHFDAARVNVANCYLAIGRAGEVETDPIFQTLWSSFPSIVTTAPRIDPETRELIPVEYGIDTPLIEGPWRIPEPQGPPIDTYEIDLVIVPLLCVDARGHRVGYGKGFYDRFLNRCRPDCLKVGLSFFPPVASITDVHSGDVALDLCVTPDAASDFTSPSEYPGSP